MDAVYASGWADGTQLLYRDRMGVQEGMVAVVEREKETVKCVTHVLPPHECREPKCVRMAAGMFYNLIC